MKLHNRKISVQLAVSCVVALWSSTSMAEPDGATSRWAILSNLSAENQGISDLLIERFSANDRFQLVDREEVREVNDEIGLAAIGAAKGAAHRQQIGQRLSADMLLILDETPIPELSGAINALESKVQQSPEVKEKAIAIRVIVCSTTAGARLHTNVVSLDGASVEATVERVYDVAEQVRQRFAGGIRYVVGVSPFLSHDLTHEFDSYQAGLARLLESSFSALPGVAVVERDEAQLVWDEIADQSDGLANRVVPVLVDGAFRSERADGGNGSSLSVTVTCRFPSAEPRKFESGHVALTKLPDWIGSLPGKTLEVEAAQIAGFTKSQQFSWLAEQARGFSRIGEWHHAMGLRQAALLLEPDGVEERLLLIDDELALLRGIASRKMPMADWLGSSNESRAAKISAVFVNLLANQEYLIRNALVNKHGAYRLLNEGRPQLSFAVRAGDEPETSFSTAVAQAEKLKKEFLWNIAPLVFELADPVGRRWNPSALTADLQHALLHQASEHVDGTPPTPTDLAFFVRLWAEQIPDNLGFAGGVSRIRYWYFPDTDRVSKPLTLTHGRRGERPGLSHDEWTAFLEALQSSPHHTASLTGRIELLIWRWYLVNQQTPQEELAKLIAESEEIDRELEKYASLSARARTSHLNPRNYSTYFDKLQWQIQRLKYVADPFAERLRMIPAPKEQRPGAAVKRMGDPNKLGRIRLVDLGLQLPFGLYPEHQLQRPISPELSQSARISADGRIYGRPQWVRWDNHIDIMWTPLEVQWMRRPGKFEQLQLAGANDVVFDDIKSDGPRLWISTLNGGIWVLNADGTVIAHITEQYGLPPTEHGLRLQPIGNGKACLAGSFGKSARGWCAIADVSGTTPTVAVVHEAKLVKTSMSVSKKVGAKYDPDFDLHQAFTPLCLFLHKTEDGRSKVYVSREMRGASSNRVPLVIDLATLKVSLGSLPVRFNGLPETQPDRFLSHGGDVLHINGLQDLTVKPGTQFGRMQVSSSQGIIEFDHEFHVPSNRGWFRVDRKTNECEDLFARSTPFVPYPFRDMTFVRSALYGIVGWGSESPFGPRLKQVVIDDEATAEPPIVEARIDPEQILRGQRTTRRTPAASDREFPLSEEEKLQLVANVRHLLRIEPPVPSDALVLYQFGPHLFDGWLPGFNMNDCWLDPPEKKEGCRIFCSHGRIICAEYLDEASRDRSYFVWRGRGGEPLLVRCHFQVQEPQPLVRRDPTAIRVPERPPQQPYVPPRFRAEFRYSAALYDDRGMLSRVVDLDTNLRIKRMTVFEHADGYQAVAIHECDAEGRCHSTREELAVDARGQGIPLGSSTPIASSRRFEKVTEPRRFGLEPYYPVEGLNESKE